MLQCLRCWGAELNPGRLAPGSLHLESFFKQDAHIPPTSLLSLISCGAIQKTHLSQRILKLQWDSDQYSHRPGLPQWFIAFNCKNWNDDKTALFLVQADTGYYLALNFLFYKIELVLINKLPGRKNGRTSLHPSKGQSMPHERAVSYIFQKDLFIPTHGWLLTLRMKGSRPPSFHYTCFHPLYISDKDVRVQISNFCSLAYVYIWE